MSILSPFEVLTNEGWKQGTSVTCDDKIACVSEDNVLEYRNVRQVFIYKSKFSFHHYNLNVFSLFLCEGIKEPFINSTTNDTSIFQSFTTMYDKEEYDPTTTLVLFNTLSILEDLQIKAACRRIPLILEYGSEQAASRLKNVSDDFYLFGEIDKIVSNKTFAVSFSCYEERETRCLIRLTNFDGTFKTICLVHSI